MRRRGTRRRATRRHGERLLAAPLTAGDEQPGLLCCGLSGRSFGDEDAGAAPRRCEPDRRRAQEGRADRAADRREHRQGHVRGARRWLGADRGGQGGEARCDLSRPARLPARRARARGGGDALAGARRAGSVAPRRLHRAPSSTPATTRCARSCRCLLDQGAADGLRLACEELGPSWASTSGSATPSVAPSARRRACARRPTPPASRARSPRRRGRSTSGSAPTATSSTSSSTRRRDRGQAVSALIDYDRDRNANLVDTLERYLAARCSVAASARALYIHPNTVRQRLERIQQITSSTCARRTSCRSSSR